MSRIRVVFSIGALHGGGSERQLVSLLRNLNRDEFEPLLYLIYRSGPLLEDVPSDVPITAFAERRPANLSRIPGLMHRRRVADMAQFLRESKADVCYDRTFLMTLVAAAAAQRIRIPNVSTIVTDPSLGFAPVAGKFQWHKRRLLRKLYSRSSRVLANSVGAARSAERFYGLKPYLVEVLYNGTDLQDVRRKSAVGPDDSWWNAAAAPGRRRVRIVSAGRLNREKGFHLLIEALRIPASRFPETELRLAILGEGDARSRLEQQITAAGLEHSVRLPGFQLNAPAWYRSADLFVLPSLLEGMPNVLLEAMACGTPIVSANCPSGPAEILNNGECGLLVDVDSVQALAEGIDEVLRNPANAVRRAAAASLRVESLFSIDAAVRRLENVLREAAGHNREIL
ncbi:MAG: glycosyltransferase [Planctomycetaceae bacterium]|nr:glycosyltransferase [Planctomycetaceae bacterium]